MSKSYNCNFLFTTNQICDILAIVSLVFLLFSCNIQLCFERYFQFSRSFSSDQWHKTKW